MKLLLKLFTLLMLFRQVSLFAGTTQQKILSVQQAEIHLLKSQ